jgi:hypothetical protein
MQRDPIHTSTDCNAPVPPGNAEKQPIIERTKRFLTCRCKTCDGWTFFSWYDTLEDIEATNKELPRLRKEGRNPAIEEFQGTDPMPKWCDCKRTDRTLA